MMNLYDSYMADSFRKNYDGISLEMGMYKTGKTLTEILEELDPSDNYKGTALEGLDAFSRQLKRFDIKVSGSQSDIVDKFFTDDQTAILFPEYVRRCVEEGMSENPIIEDIVAVTTNIDGMDYRSVSARAVNNCETRISINDNLCNIHKRGRLLVASYEALRFQRISLLSVMLKQIGQYIRKKQLFDALEELSTVEWNWKPIKCYGGISVSDIHSIAKELCEGNGFTLNTLLCPMEIVSILKEKFSDLIKYDNGNMYLNQIRIIPVLGDLTGKIIGIDKHYALEMVKSGGVYVDYEKLINKQFERAEISCKTGFSLIFPKAVSTRIME